MIFMLQVIQILIHGFKCLTLVPRYETGTIVLPQYSIILQRVSNNVYTQTLSFAQAFCQPPKVVLSWLHLDQNSGLNYQYTYQTQISETQFSLVVGTTGVFNSLKIIWVAIQDDNIYVQYGNITQNIDSQIVDVPISIINVLSIVPNAALFLNGLKITKTPNNLVSQYQFYVDQVTDSQFHIQVNMSQGFAVSWFSYTIIYGNSQFLLTGYHSLNSLYQNSSYQIFTPDSRTKFSMISITGLDCLDRIKLDAQCNANGLLRTHTWYITITQLQTYVYIQYMPCPLYCTTCYTAQPNCDGCLVTSYRIGADCTQCSTNMFLISGQINCQQCEQYCNGCSTVSTQCTACSVMTFRINLPSCTQCPSQMVLEAGILNCQYCSGYCNQCTVNRYQCTVCQPITQRTNPPYCNICPSQCHTVSNILNCQPCQQYCDNCLAYSSACILCSIFNLRINPPDCLDCPLNMYPSGDTCIQCDSSCATCNLQGCLTCLTNQYLNYLQKCIDCPVHCLTCNAQDCFTCAGDCHSCSRQICLKCYLDNQYISGTNCITCPNNCQTCNAQTCLSCIGLQVVIDNICQCQLPCLTCDQNQCLTCISDYRLMNGKCLYCPSDCFLCDQEENCLQKPQNCMSAMYSESQVQCTLCDGNYYLSQNKCIKCAINCLQCSASAQNCTSCRFPQLDQVECLLCEQTNGYYSDFQTNICYTTCGDGILVDNEQCDDGNNYNRDGCTDCIIDPGYMCLSLVCWQITYPIPIFKQDILSDSPYNSLKLFNLFYNVPILVQSMDFTLKIEPPVSFNYTILQQNPQQFQILVILQNQSINAVLQLTFETPSLIISESGIQQQIVTLKSEISEYQLQNNFDEQTMKSTDQTTNILLILLIVFIFISLLFGGLGIFWNLLDLLQTISYLKYINTIKPYHLHQLLSLFGSIQFQNLPLNTFINIQEYLENLTHNNEFKDPPLLIKDDGYMTSSIINILPLINIVFIGFCMYYLAKLILLLQQRIHYQPSFSKIHTNVKIWIFIYKIYSYLLKCSKSICNQWFYSGLIRIFISSCNDICFMISLGIYGVKLQTHNTFRILDILVTIIMISSYFIIASIITNISLYSIITLYLNENKYGAVHENLKLVRQARLYTTFLNHKKFVFMIFLVLLYKEPLFQILTITLIQVKQIMYLIIIDPIRDQIERKKQVICELLMLIAEIQLALLVIDDYLPLCMYDNRRYFGWICVFTIISMLITQIYFDVRQQFKQYYQKYALVRKVQKCLGCT